MKCASRHATCGGQVALSWLIAGLLLALTVGPAAAQTKARKKPVSVEAATPKKKARLTERH